MTARARTLVLLLSLAACGAPAQPWQAPPSVPLDLRIALSATSVHLLEPVTVQLDLYRQKDLEVEFAPAIEGRDFLVEQHLSPEVPFGDGVWQHRTFVLRPVRGPGELVLPSLVAKAKDGTAASTPEQKITVLSSLGDQGAAIEAPGQPFPAPGHLGWWLAGGAGGALVLAALGFAARRRRRAGSHRQEVAVPAHVKALRALAPLRTAPRTTPLQVEAFYVSVSSVLRVYLEERFGLRAPERTTEEFLRDLEGGAQLARAHRAELERFLSQCDLVKFAAANPTEGDHLATFALAEAFVESTRADRAEAEVPA